MNLKFPVGSKVLIYGVDTFCAGFMSSSSHCGKKEYENEAIVEDFSTASRGYIIRLKSGRVLREILEEEIHEC